MESKKNILIFRYSDMRLGGIQKIVYNYIKLFLGRSDRVVWIAPGKRDVHPGYRELVNPEKITICDQSQAEEYIKSLCRENIAAVVMLSFRPSDYLKMTELEYSLREYDVRNYLVIPHYKGCHLFLEENYRMRAGKKRFLVMREFYRTLLENRSILFCSLKQAESFEEHYDIPIADKSAVLLPVPILQPGPEDAYIRNRFGTQHIISVCRFSFPHKGYVLGLIRTYGTLKGKYPGLRLTLIGYGDGMERLERTIQTLPAQAQQDIRVIPGVSFDDLPSYYAQATVAVGLAGAASTSAADALITVIARHYCEDCEVYGSYAEHWEKTGSEDPGDPILPELERILNLTEEAYLEESLRTRKAYEQRTLPRLQNICTDYCVERICVLTPAQIAQLNIMAERAEALRRRKRLRYWLMHPFKAMNRLKDRRRVPGDAD